MQPYVSLILVSIRQGKAALRSCDKNGREQCRLSFSKKENQHVHSMKFLGKRNGIGCGMEAVICGLSMAEKDRWAWHWKKKQKTKNHPLPRCLSPPPPVQNRNQHIRKARGWEAEEGNKNIDLGKEPSDAKMGTCGNEEGRPQSHGQ